MDDFNDNFENDCLTELGNREAWEDSQQEHEDELDRDWDFNDHDDDNSDCGSDNDIEEEDTQ